MKTYCKEDIYNSTKIALDKYYNFINQKISNDIADIDSVNILGINSKFDSLAFITFIMFLDKELKIINFKKNLLFELQKKNFEELSIKNLIEFINEIE